MWDSENHDVYLRAAVLWNGPSNPSLHPGDQETAGGKDLPKVTEPRRGGLGWHCPWSADSPGRGLEEGVAGGDGCVCEGTRPCGAPSHEGAAACRPCLRGVASTSCFAHRPRWPPRFPVRVSLAWSVWQASFRPASGRA